MHATRIDMHERAEVGEITAAEIVVSCRRPCVAYDANDKGAECYFCGEEGHYEAGCYKRRPELGIEKALRVSSVLLRSVNAIDEENSIDRSSKVTGYHTGVEVVYLWLLGTASTTTLGNVSVCTQDRRRVVYVLMDTVQSPRVPHAAREFRSYDNGNLIWGTTTYRWRSLTTTMGSSTWYGTRSRACTEVDLEHG